MTDSPKSLILPIAGALSVGIISICSFYLMRKRASQQHRHGQGPHLPESIRKKYGGGCIFAPLVGAQGAEQEAISNSSQHKTQKFILVQTKMLTSTEHPVIYLTFKTEGEKPMNIEPGQHIYMHFHKCEDGVNKTQKRPYSPVDRVAHNSRVSFAVKVYPDGHGSQHLSKMAPGDSIEFTGPSKSLFHLGDIDRRSTRIFFLCSGSGFTPFCGMLRQLFQEHSEECANPVFVFANKTWEDVFFTEEMYQWNQSGKIDVIHALSQEKQIEGDKARKFHPEFWTEVIGGRIHKDKVKELYQKYKSIHNKFLICGTSQFVRATRASLKDLGIQRADIKCF